MPQHIAIVSMHAFTLIS